MFDSSFHHTSIDGESNRSSFSFTGAESERGYRALGWNGYLYHASQPCHIPSSVYLEPRTSIIPPNDWLPDSPIGIHESATVTQLYSFPFPLPPTLGAAPTPFYASGSSPPHSGYSESFHVTAPFTSKSDSNIAVMPNLTGHAVHGGHSIDVHTCHYGPSFGSPSSIVECPRAVPSPLITMPVVPTPLGADTSSGIDPDLPPVSTLEWSPRHPTATFQNLPPPDSTLTLDPSERFDSESHSSPGPPPPAGNYSFVATPSEMSGRIHPLPVPCITTSVGQLYTLTVPSETVEFSGTGEAPFFQCRWADCGIWLTSEKNAVKNHLVNFHNVMLKGKCADQICCEWVGCSSSFQRNGLVRHFRAHLGLKWLCSLCRTAYTRQDSVWFHARKEPRCQSAWAISHPSAVAYKARINGDNTITLTKILQQSYMT